MNLDNFVVRPHRRAVEKYAQRPAWTKLPREALTELATEVAGLPSEIDSDHEEAKRKIVYTDFEDEMGGESVVTLPGLGESKDFAKFRAKAQAFLRAHQDHVAIRKLRTNKPLTAVDLAELERMLAESGVGTADDIGRAKAESAGLGVFVRSLVGLDREAAKAAFAGFLSGKSLGGNQIEFVNLIVDHLTEHGVMDPALLYESPFTDLAPKGPSGLFSSAQVVELMTVLTRLRDSAAAA